MEKRYVIALVLMVAVMFGLELVLWSKAPQA